MDWFWHVLIICVIVIPVTLLWVAIIIELFRRRDLSVWARLAWLLLILVLPLIGALTYVVVTWLQSDRDRDLGAAPDAGDIKHPSDVSDLAKLDQARRSGVITEEEFAQGRRRILEGTRERGDAGMGGRHTAREVS